MASTFNTLESIYQMLQPADLLASQKVGLGNASIDNINVLKQLQDIIISSTKNGTNSAQNLLINLNRLRLISNDDNETDKKIFDRLINFYTTAGTIGRIDDVQYPYMYKDTQGVVQNNVTVDQIANVTPEIRNHNDLSIILSKTPFISPAIRDAQKVEMFLNFLPSIVLARCQPYLDLEFVFNRDIQSASTLSTAGMLKFLMGGAQVIDDGSANSIMYNARASIGSDNKSSTTSAGMELFTSPQTLVNLDKLQPGYRYVDVIDPMRPFATLESVTINVTPMPGVMSYKKATVVFKLHDRSRLAEIADLIQPTTYPKTTIWLTYGWRHPYEPSGDTTATQTYADFINGNMLTKEAYGIVNSQFSFDAVGQVSITLELYTKSVTELRNSKFGDDPIRGFRAVNEKLENLSKMIGQYKRDMNLVPRSGLNAEVRPTQLLDTAEQGTFPDKLPAETFQLISDLEKILTKTGTPPQKQLGGDIIRELRDLYGKSDKNTKVYEFKQQISTMVSEYIANKFNELRTGPDPFLPFQEKSKKQKEETGLNVEHPLLQEINYYNSASDVISPELTKEGLKKSVVSFGKLFSVFMAPTLFSMQDAEYQIFFYSFNDKCGKLSACNIAEFPIDLPVFLRQYREIVEYQRSSVMTVEQFIKLVIDTQISDDRAIGYGFRSSNIFKPWDPKGRDPVFQEGKNKDYENIMMSVNENRGPFQKPQIELYIESTYTNKSTSSENNVTVDLLNYYERSSVTTGDPYDTKRIVKIHIYDKTANPYKLAGTLLKSDNPNGSITYAEVDTDSWVKMHDGTIETQANNEIMKNMVSFSERSNSDGTTSNKKIVGTIITSDMNNQSIKNLISKTVPTLVYGMNTSAILDASLSTKYDANLSSAQMLGLNAGRKTVALPSGGGVGGLPLKVIPAQLSMRTIGCPLINYSQMFFVDFNTGTTIDNIYGVTGLTHTLTPGKFETSLSLGFFDAYGKYEVSNTVNNLASIIKDVENINENS